MIYLWIGAMVVLLGWIVFAAVDINRITRRIEKKRIAEAREAIYKSTTLASLGALRWDDLVVAHDEATSAAWSVHQDQLGKPRTLTDEEKIQFERHMWRAQIIRGLMEKAADARRG